MASVARDILVPALQWEFGICSVIEDEFFPPFRTVALGAHLAITPIVRIIDQMAADTLLWGVLVVIIGVTQSAVQLSVLATEWVFRIKIVVEGLLAPALFVMAGFTLLTKLPFVGIIGFMTIKTQRRRLAVFLVFLGMTELACQGCVSSLETEIGLTVIERLTVQIDDIPLPAFVFRMTALTVFCLFRIKPAVKTHALFDVLSDITMVMT